MADNLTPGQNDAGRPPDDPQERLAQAGYELDFELARLESYYSYESRFYTVVSKTLVIVSLVAGTSSFAAVTALLAGTPGYTLIAAVVALASTLLTVIGFVADFKDQARFYTEKKALYRTWRSELAANENNLEWVTNKRNEMLTDWGSSAKVYTVHYAIEALAWNDAVLMTRGPEHVRMTELYDVWWWERFVGHFVKFSRERFARRKISTKTFPKSVLLYSSAALIVVALVFFGATVVLICLAIQYGSTLTLLRATLLWFVAFALLALAFLFFDAGFHKTRRALLPTR